jgi:hypothetical protein
MLRKETVKPGTLDLILHLMKDQQLNSFYLVGGTALALRLGHRESIDIDMFTSSQFSGDELAIYLREKYNATIKRQRCNYISGNIRGVDFDFITHDYTSIKPVDTIQWIRMLSNADIAAMKINAIVNSGQRIKDFIDIHYLLKEFSLKNILDFYCRKYPNVDANTGRASLGYHNDIDFNVQVILKDKKLKWADVQKSILSAVSEYDRLLAQAEFAAKLRAAVKGNNDIPKRENIVDQTPDVSNDESEDNDQDYDIGYSR